MEERLPPGFARHAACRRRLCRYMPCLSAELSTWIHFRTLLHCGAASSQQLPDSHPLSCRACAHHCPHERHRSGLVHEQLWALRRAACRPRQLQPARHQGQLQKRIWHALAAAAVPMQPARHRMCIASWWHISSDLQRRVLLAAQTTQLPVSASFLNHCRSASSTRPPLRCSRSSVLLACAHVVHAGHSFPCNWPCTSAGTPGGCCCGKL